MNSKVLGIALLALGLLGLTALAGFFWTRGPTYGEIEGRVTRGGVPLEQVQVIFYPEEDGPRSVALTDEDGRFVAMTDGTQSVPARKGAPPGKYRVALVDRRDEIRTLEQMARTTAAQAGTLHPIPRGVQGQPQEKKNNASARVPAQYNKRLDTPFDNIEIKLGKNWFDLDVK